MKFRSLLLLLLLLLLLFCLENRVSFLALGHRGWLECAESYGSGNGKEKPRGS